MRPRDPGSVIRIQGTLAGIALAALLAGCGSAPKRPAADREVYSPHQGQTSRRGGYYQDDGPGASPPPNIEAIESAEPKVEPLHRSANNPYTVFGTQYVPAKALRPYKQRGIASWYGRKFHGQRTSSGEIYDMYKMTAAHPTLPIPSYVRVTHVRSGKNVIVRINDRGPFHPGRIIDLSYAAAAKLGFVNAGSALVEVEAILPEDMPQIAAARRAPRPPDTTPPLAVASSPPDAQSAGPIEVAALAESKPPQAESIPATSEAAGVYLQLGAFSARDNAESLRAKLQQQLSWLNQTIVVLYREGLFRVHLGPYHDQIEASDVAARIGEAFELKPVIVVR